MRMKDLIPKSVLAESTNPPTANDYRMVKEQCDWAEEKLERAFKIYRTNIESANWALGKVDLYCPDMDGADERLEKFRKDIWDCIQEVKKLAEAAEDKAKAKTYEDFQKDFANRHPHDHLVVGK